LQLEKTTTARKRWLLLNNQVKTVSYINLSPSEALERGQIFSIYLSFEPYKPLSMQKKLIFLIAFMVLIAVFALQNSVEVEIQLWFWSVRTSMVLVLILTFAAGAIAGILFSIPGRPKESKKTTKDPDETPASHAPGDEVPLEVKNPKDLDEFEDVGN
jgi:uncharacterized integral membrane protein